MRHGEHGSRQAIYSALFWAQFCEVGPENHVVLKETNNFRSCSVFWLYNPRSLPFPMSQLCTGKMWQNPLLWHAWYLLRMLRWLNHFLPWAWGVRNNHVICLTPSLVSVGSRFFFPIPCSGYICDKRIFQIVCFHYLVSSIFYCGMTTSIHP